MIRICLIAALSLLLAAPSFGEEGVPRYDHIFVIILENKSVDDIIGNGATPVLQALAKQYGLASNFYAEIHPSEGNYVAMLGGDNFAIHDDDAYFCKPKQDDPACSHSGRADYQDHTVTEASLTDQLLAHGLSWKGYFEDIPEPGSPVYRSAGDATRPAALYAVKHNGFMSFRSVQLDPERAARIVGFDALDRDLISGQLPNFAHIVPNQCNDMHGLDGDNVPPDCRKGDMAGLYRRGDQSVDRLVKKLMAAPFWQSAGNNAIIITFDEGGHSNPTHHPEGCCGFEPGSAANFGGGWIATIVITSHGPRGLDDPTAYNHYSLLRTIEDAFGISNYLGHAADSAKGVVAMRPLFAVTP